MKQFPWRDSGMNQFSGGEKENTWLSSERDGESSVTNRNYSGVRILVKYVGNVM